MELLTCDEISVTEISKMLEMRVLPRGSDACVPDETKMSDGQSRKDFTVAKNI